MQPLTLPQKDMSFAGINSSQNLLNEDELLAAIRETLYKPWANAQLLATYCEAAMPFFAGSVGWVHPAEIRTLLTDANAWNSLNRFCNHAESGQETKRFHGAGESCWYGWIPAGGDKSQKITARNKKFTHYIGIGRFLVHQPLYMLTLTKAAAQSRLQQYITTKSAELKPNDNTRKLLRIFLLVAQKHFGRELGLLYPGHASECTGTKIVLSEEQLASKPIELYSAQLYRCHRDSEQPQRNITYPCSNEARPDAQGNLIFDCLD